MITLLASSFLWAACVAVLIPLLIHLLSRGKPKREIFPAMRFIQETYVSNRRRFRLKRFLLLALRALTLILFGLLLARPVWHALPRENTRSGSGSARVAAFVFDTSLRMEYEQGGKSRLDEAKTLAPALLDQMPTETRVAIFDTQGGGGTFQVDLLAARERIERLCPAPQRLSLTEAVSSAVRLLAEVEGEKEILIFSDRSAAAWPPEQTDSFRRILDESGASIRFYFADFAPDLIRNISLSQVRTAVSVREREGEATIDVLLTAVGGKSGGKLEMNCGSPLSAGGERTVLTETFTEAEFSESGEQRKSFSLRHLSPGIYQGSITKTPPDPLAADDRVCFTFEIRPPKNLLLVAPEPASEHALFMKSALFFDEHSGRAAPQPEVISYGRLAEMPLAASETAALLLLDPPPLSAELATRIEAFVHGGGGAGFFLGRNGAGENTPEYVALLGGEPIRPVNVPEGTTLIPDPGGHTLLSGFRTSGEALSAPWSQIPIYRHWRVEWDRNNPPSVAMRYTDGGAALVERAVGRGRVVVSTTPFSDRPNDPKAWNRITVGDHAWLFLVLAEGIARTLTEKEGSLNIAPFEIASFAVETDKNLAVLTPERGEIALSLPALENRLSFSGTGDLGSYVFLGGEKQKTLGGFSVNPRAEQLRLDPLSFDELQDLFGKTRLNRIDSAQKLESLRNRLDSPADLYSLLALLFGAVLVAELFSASRLYE